MLLIPQIFLRNGKVILPEGTRSFLLKEDPVACADALATAGAEWIHVIDLSIPHVGQSTNLPLVKKIREQHGAQVTVGGAFRTQQAVDGYVNAGCTFVALDSVAYQQPAFLAELCKTFSGKIATHIDVKGGHVTIPGYAVVTNKSAFDYAQQFLETGVRYILYSDVRSDGTMGDENFQGVLHFCRKVMCRIVCTSEVAGLPDIERMLGLSAPRLEGLVLNRALAEDRFDLRSAVTRISDLILAGGNDSTLPEV
jgi:phosphoribosylformimino-5-aminoimidazole carboxamide ribotide isomerase